jgi:hypothetical protein
VIGSPCSPSTRDCQCFGPPRRLNITACMCWRVAQVEALGRALAAHRKEVREDLSEEVRHLGQRLGCGSSCVPFGGRF